MTDLTEQLRPTLMPFLEPGEDLWLAFMGANFDVSALDGGTSRIIAVTDRALVVVRTGLLRRTTPYAVETRRAFGALRNPLFAWPGKTLYGEEFAEVMDGIWVHRRYRPSVMTAYGLAVRAAG